jgi:hypothetical protein
MMQTPWKDPAWIAQTQLMLNSYRHWIKVDLIPRVGSLEEQSRAVFEAPFVLVAHGTQADPLLCYANRRALDLWEMDVETLLRTESRATAEPVHRDERARMLNRTTRDGYVDDYSGIRISRTGRRFRIKEAIVWNLIDEAENYRGQAASFTQWEPISD